MQSIMIRSHGRIEQYYDAASVYNAYSNNYTDFRSWIKYLKSLKKNSIRIVNDATYIEKEFIDELIIIPATSVIYFILGGDHLIKIGTTSSIKRRIKEIFTASPLDLKVIHTMPGTFIEERELHKRFKQYHYKGEWFFYSSEIKEFIDERIKNGYSNISEKTT